MARGMESGKLSGLRREYFQQEEGVRARRLVQRVGV
jgi:hypothetical protein